MTAFDNLREAVIRARNSRSDLRLRTDGTIRRLAPERLADDALDFAQLGLREGLDHSRRHPFIAAGVAAGVLAWLLRAPLLSRAEAWLANLSENRAETTEPDSSHSRYTGNNNGEAAPDSETTDHDR